MDYFDLLPRDVVYYILRYLDLIEMLKIINLKQYDLWNNEIFWANLAQFKYDFNKERFSDKISYYYLFGPHTAQINHLDNSLTPAARYLQLYLQPPLPHKPVCFGDIFIGQIIEIGNLEMIKIITKKNNDKREISQRFIYNAGKSGKKEVVDYFLELAKSNPKYIGKHYENYQWHLDQILLAVMDIKNKLLIDYVIEINFN